MINLNLVLIAQTNSITMKSDIIKIKIKLSLTYARLKHDRSAFLQQQQIVIRIIETTRTTKPTIRPFHC